MKKLLLDLDGTIVDYYSSFSSFLNNNYGTTLDTTKEPSHYNFSDWGNGSEKIDYVDVSSKWILSGGYKNLKIYDGGSEFYKYLDNNFDVHIVTARIGDFKTMDDKATKQIVQDTTDWLERNNIKTDQLKFHHDKIKYCINMGINTIVEDKLSTALEGAKNGINTVLINRGWNQNPPRFRIYRAYNYNEAKDFLDKIK